MPTLIDFVLFFVLGLCGSVANLLLTQSYRLAEASLVTVSYTHLRAHETDSYLVCRLLLEKKTSLRVTRLPSL